MHARGRSPRKLDRRVLLSRSAADTRRAHPPPRRDSRKASGVPHVSLSVSGAARRARRERRGAGERGPTAETHLPVDVYAGNRSNVHPSSARAVALCRREGRRQETWTDKKCEAPRVEF